MSKPIYDTERIVLMTTRYVNAHAFTGCEGFISSFVVENDCFVMIGNEQDTHAAYPEAATVDLDGQFVCAGFNDSHMHLLSLGNTLSMCQLAPHSSSLSGMLSTLKQYADSHPEETFVLGRGWNHDDFTDVSRFPTRYDLDSVCPDRPCMITRCCGHVAIANSAALSLAGIENQPIPVEGGRIELGCDGRPNGVLSENAISIVSTHVPKLDRAAIRRRLELAMSFVNSRGITSVQTDDFSSTDLPFEEIISAYMDLKAAGKLTVRITEQCLLPDVSSLKRFLQAGYCTGWGDEWFRIGPLKLLVDGSLGARTALLRAPYSDAPETSGIAIYSQDTLNELVLLAHQSGMQIAIHAIGDGGADLVLNAFEYAQSVSPRENARHGIVHAQVLNHEQAARMKALGLHAYIQSIFLDYDTQIVRPRLGQRADQAYPAASLLRQGVTLSNGSDCPVELPDVAGGMQCAITRASFTRKAQPPYLPEEALSVEQALLSYTAFGAYASFEEGKKGRIAPGCLADFTVLSSDPFRISPDQMHTLKPLSVYLGGSKVL